MSEIRTLRAETLGRYLLEPGPSAAPLLLGFHGYGQDAESLMESLRRIPGAASWTCVSVQALHRFYNTKTQAVVGSWMTSLDREQAIADNLAYVGRVIAELRAEGRGGPLAFAGFSQGAAMAWRAAARFPCAALIVLGGDLPKDVIEQPGLQLPPMLLGRGEADPIYTEAQFQKDEAALRDKGFEPQVLRFEGGHEWGEAFLSAAGRFLEGLHSQG